MTFSQCADIYMAEKKAQNKWSSQAHIDQWKATPLKPTKMVASVNEMFVNLPVLRLTKTTCSTS